jgi:hypothetical protein
MEDAMLRMLSLCAVALGVAVLGGTAVIAADLPPQALRPFQAYLKLPHILGYRAFVVEPESGAWGKSTGHSQSGIAVDQAIAGCERRSARKCQVYAVGDIVTFGLADWMTEVAVALYRVKRNATNDDLEAVTSRGGDAAALALSRSVLHAAAEMGITEAVAAMLDRGVDIDAESEVGATALSYAAARGHREAVALLLDRGADVNARNGVGKTALGVALLANNFARARSYLADDHDAVIRLIVDAGGIE